MATRDTTSVRIGIQARSTSKRFPNKVTALIGQKTMLDWVISKCTNSASYFDRNMGFISAAVSLLVPFGDPIKAQYQDRIEVIEGPEDDVLARYMLLSEKHLPDYLVRITSDCPLLPPWLITKHISIAVMSGLDYLSNVDERCRTAPDGFDCEVISRHLLEHTNIAAKEPKDREHVTTWIRANFPSWATRGFTINNVDQSSIKWSVDNQEDLERVRGELDQIESKKNIADQIYGEKRVFRL